MFLYFGRFTIASNFSQFCNGSERISILYKFFVSFNFTPIFAELRHLEARGSIAFYCVFGFVNLFSGLNVVANAIYLATESDTAARLQLIAKTSVVLVSNILQP